MGHVDADRSIVLDGQRADRELFDFSDDAVHGVGANATGH